MILREWNSAISRDNTISQGIHARRGFRLEQDVYIIHLSRVKQVVLNDKMHWEQDMP